MSDGCAPGCKCQCAECSAHRTTASDATAGDGLRDAIDRALFRSGADNYDLAPDLILAALRDVLATAARDAETIKRVREVHVSDRSGSCKGCEAECYMCQGVHEWPCATIQALDGAR